MAQTPDQHWQATPNYPPNNPPNYQPSTAPAAPAAPPATGNPAAGPPATGQYQYPQQPDQPVGPPQYPVIERREPAAAGPPAYGNQPPDNRAAYPQDPRVQGAAGQGQGVAGPPGAGPPIQGPIQGPPIQGPPVRPAAPQAPFVLSPPEAAALDRLLNGLGKAEQGDPRPGVEVLSLEVRRRVRQRPAAAAPTKAS